MGNQMIDKLVIGKTIKTRQFLEKAREQIMKANGRKIRTQEWSEEYKVPAGMLAWMVKAGCVECELGTGYAPKEGRIIKWVYEPTENGIVDGPLVNAVMQAEKDANKALKLEKMSQTLNEHPPVPKETFKKLPTGNSATISDISKWIQGEIEKNEKVPGYIRNSDLRMYIRIDEMLNQLKPLRDILCNLNL